MNSSVKKICRLLIEKQPAEFLKWRRRVEWAAQIEDENGMEGVTTLLQIVAYHKKFSHLPDNYSSLREFVKSSGDEDEASQFLSNSVNQDTAYLEEDESEVPTDIDVLANDFVEKARKSYFSKVYQKAALISSGEVKGPNKQTGAEAARAFIREAWSNEMLVESKVDDGDWIEHVDSIQQSLVNQMEESAAYRIFTGFSKIDESAIIGKKFLKWIGLLGYTSHGKSTFLLSLLYNMAKDGHNILFVPREFSVEDTWQRLTLIHASQNKFLKIPPLETWIMSPQNINEENRRDLAALMDDLKSKKEVKGDIDVKRLSSWSEITEYLEVNHAKKKYDVLAVDYMGHLQVEGKNAVEEHNKDFRSAQMLSQNFNDGEGLVVITPLQANKKGHDEAAKREGDKKGCYLSLGAVDWYTQAAQDMDMVISIWYDDDCKSLDEMKVQCLKQRGRAFQTHTLTIDRDYRYVKDTSAPSEIIIPETQGTEPGGPVSDTTMDDLFDAYGY